MKTVHVRDARETTSGNIEILETGGKTRTREVNDPRGHGELRKQRMERGNKALNTGGRKGKREPSNQQKQRESSN